MKISLIIQAKISLSMQVNFCLIIQLKISTLMKVKIGLTVQPGDRDGLEEDGRE